MIITQPDRVILRRQIAEHAGKLTGTLLDVGAGEGTRYRDLFTAAEKYITLEHDMRFKPDLVGSAEAIPSDDASVDSIVCTQVLEHVPHPQKVISESFRVLKPGGKALFTAPQWNELHEEPRDFFRYTCFGFRTMFEEAGFNVIELDQRGKYHAFRAQSRIRYWIDRYKPYDNKLAMWFFGPLSLILTRYALWKDTRDNSEACKKHVIGWAVFVEKPV